jgi:hypothetical protein
MDTLKRTEGAPQVPVFSLRPAVGDGRASSGPLLIVAMPAIGPHMRNAAFTANWWWPVP